MDPGHGAPAGEFIGDDSMAETVVLVPVCADQDLIANCRQLCDHMTDQRPAGKQGQPLVAAEPAALPSCKDDAGEPGFFYHLDAKIVDIENGKWKMENGRWKR